ncbi:MAG TPA: tetratricopeptide repeat protein, partial [Deferrisomatales bacterium]|nr:tetratricopeptide repeat protein [Deferrisomatales bacterium]
MDTAMIELYHQGREAFEENRYEEARRYFNRLTESGCRFADVFNMLGAIAFSLGDYAGARAQFATAVELNPRYTEAHLNLAVTLNETGDYGSAAMAYEGAGQASTPAQGGIDPYVKGRLANLHADIGEIYHGLGLHEESVTEYSKALALGPLFPDLRVRLGILYRDMGEYQKALDEFGKVKQDHPDFPAAGVQLGITY